MQLQPVGYKEQRERGGNNKFITSFSTYRGGAWPVRVGQRVNSGKWTEYSGALL